MNLFRKMTELESSGIPFVHLITVDARGSTPQDSGSQAVVGIDGLIDGTVGGGKVEAKAIQHAISMLHAKPLPKTDFITWNLQRDVGMTCGGEVKIYFETHVSNAWEIAVFGAGHVAQKLIPLLTTLECRVICVDPRAEWLDRLPAHPRLVRIRSDSPANEVDPRSKDAFFVLVSQGHATDFPVLKRVLETREDVPYLGVIGSHSKRLVLRKELEEAGIARPRSEAFLCPIGLPIGGSAPEEIAISVAAQLLEIREKSRTC